MDNSSVSPVDNSSAVSGLQSHAHEFGQKFKALQAAVQSGDAGEAQKALNSFQTASKNASASGINPLDQSDGVSKSFQTFSSAVKSGDIKSAQTALSSMMQELQKTDAVQQAQPRVKKDDNEASSPSSQVNGVSLNAVA